MQSTKTEPEADAPLNVGRILNIIGVFFLIVGAIFLLGLSWASIGAGIKIGLGMMAAIALIGYGEINSMKHAHIKWFGQGLVGGGYALAYFVVYAMQNVKEVALFDIPVLDIALLLGLTFVSTQHALFRKSQVIAALSATLAMVAISLNPVTLLSVAACAILAAGMSYVVVKTGWNVLHVIGCVGPYITFGCLTARHIAYTTVPEHRWWIELGFLGAIWLANLIASLGLVERTADMTRQESLLAATITANGLLFAFIGLGCLSGQLDVFRYCFLNLIGVIYMRLAHMFGKHSRRIQSLAYFVGLSLITAAIPIEASARAVPAVLAVEVALLVWAGLKFDLKIFRAFAAVLAVYSWFWISFLVMPSHDLVSLRGIIIEWPLVVAFLGLASLFLSGWCYRLPQFESVQSKGWEKDVMTHIYCFMASYIALAMPFVVSGNQIATIAWPLTGITLIAFGFKFDSVVYRGWGLSFFAAVTGKLLLFDLSHASSVQRALSFVVAGVAFLLGSYAYAWLGNKARATAGADEDEPADAEGPAPEPSAA